MAERSDYLNRGKAGIEIIVKSWKNLRNRTGGKTLVVTGVMALCLVAVLVLCISGCSFYRNEPGSSQFIPMYWKKQDEKESEENRQREEKTEGNGQVEKKQGENGQGEEKQEGNGQDREKADRGKMTGK